jgi:hypothetical protein
MHTKLQLLKKKPGNHLENIDIYVTIILKPVDQLSFLILLSELDRYKNSTNFIDN